MSVFVGQSTHLASFGELAGCWRRSFGLGVDQGSWDLGRGGFGDLSSFGCGSRICTQSVLPGKMETWTFKPAVQFLVA